MCDSLAPEHAENFQFAITGHNVLVTAQAGTGKSRVVNVIREHCQQCGLRAAVVCLSGIACQVYDPGIASTVHSYYGLEEAHLPSEQLLNCTTSDMRICEKVKKVGVIIWEEASMSSPRMLELVNKLHHSLSDQHDNALPFRGKQIIVGEFLQLRPVPSTFDSGSFMFTSHVFHHTVPHRF